jgi:Na+-driven multidrug efflux pump
MNDPSTASRRRRRSRHDREIAALAAPALGALIAEPLYVLADTAVVGHLGTPQLAGLAVASSVLLTLYAVFIFLAYGTTAAVSRLLGAGDEREAAHQAVQSMWLALVIGIVVAVVGAALSGPLWPTSRRPTTRPVEPVGVGSGHFSWLRRAGHVRPQLRRGRHAQGRRGGRHAGSGRTPRWHG